MKLLPVLLSCFWEFPQNLAGVMVWIFMRSKITMLAIRHNRIFLQNPRLGISLGIFIFWTNIGESSPSDKARNKWHEYGHSIQSLIFGPLYLVAVGIPSLLRNGYCWLYYRITKRQWANYYKGYPEAWADRLGRYKT